LDVYRAALAFDALANKAVPKRGHRVLRDQLDRASIGIVLCIAEGAGRRSAPDKRRFYEMARGSATESAAVLDILRSRTLLTDDAHAEARHLLVRIAPDAYPHERRATRPVTVCRGRGRGRDPDLEAHKVREMRPMRRLPRGRDKGGIRGPGLLLSRTRFWDWARSPSKRPPVGNRRWLGHMKRVMGEAAFEIPFTVRQAKLG